MSKGLGTNNPLINKCKRKLYNLPDVGTVEDVLTSHVKLVAGTCKW